MSNQPKVDEKWQAECDLRTLTEAMRIKSDKNRTAAAMKMAAEQQATLAKLKGKENG